MKTIKNHINIFLIASVIMLGLAPTLNAMSGKTAMATFAGGCFWCMEKPFEKLEGVISVTSGYMGGKTANPTYENYAGGGHIEVVRIIYEPSKIIYEELLDVFWRQIDPTDAGGQFVDRGHAYISAIFCHTPEQRELAEKSKSKMDKSGMFPGPIVTGIVPAAVFYAAEEYHQDYYKNNPIRYRFYRHNSGRDQFLDKIWGKDRMN